jgi:uncharacterized protein (DUF934 family)
MPTLIKHREIVPDTWTVLADDAAWPAAGDVIVSLARLQRDVAALTAAPCRVGVRLPVDADPIALAAELGPALLDRPLLSVWIPSYRDGRHFTAAYLLRTRLGFRGELRAEGDVLPDQLFYMQRVGYDAFALKDGKRPEDGLRALQAFGVRYQASADAAPLFREHARPAAR